MAAVVYTATDCKWAEATLTIALTAATPSPDWQD